MLYNLIEWYEKGGDIVKLKKLLSLGLVSMFVAGFPISANALETIYTI